MRLVSGGQASNAASVEVVAISAPGLPSALIKDRVLLRTKLSQFLNIPIADHAGGFWHITRKASLPSQIELGSNDNTVTE